jgi:hypothetical protein
MIHELVPGAQPHEVLLRRTGTVTDTEFGMVPDQLCGISCRPASGTREN